MSAIKAGDKIYFQGNQGKVMRVTHDENEPLLEVVLTQKRLAYLKPSQLDLYPFAEQLNENQQIVLENLKINATDNYTKSVNRLFSSIAVFADAEPAVDNRISKAYVSLNTYQEAQVLEVFSRWALEQEEE